MNWNYKKKYANWLTYSATQIRQQLLAAKGADLLFSLIPLTFHALYKFMFFYVTCYVHFMSEILLKVKFSHNRLVSYVVISLISGSCSEKPHFRYSDSHTVYYIYKRWETTTAPQNFIEISVINFLVIRIYILYKKLTLRRFLVYLRYYSHIQNISTSFFLLQCMLCSIKCKQLRSNKTTPTDIKFWRENDALSEYLERGVQLLLIEQHVFFSWWTNNQQKHRVIQIIYFKLGKTANLYAFSVINTDVAKCYALRERVLIWVLSIKAIMQGVCIASLSDHTDCILLSRLYSKDIWCN